LGRLPSTGGECTQQSIAGQQVPTVSSGAMTELAIRGGTIVTPAGQRRADLGIAEGRVVEVADTVEGAVSWRWPTRSKAAEKSTPAGC